MPGAVADDADEALRQSEARFTELERERAATERALAESAELFKKVFHVIPDAVSVTDLESGNIVDANEGFERLFCIPRAELIGASSIALELWAKSEARVEFVGRVSREGSVRDFAAQARLPSGELRDCLVSADRVEVGGRTCMVSVIRDVTEQRRSELARKKLEEGLREAQKMEAIGALAGGIAHDFNNILGAIVAYTDLARLDADGNTRVLESLDDVLKASARAKDLVAQILAFSRRQPQARRSMRLQPVVKEVLRLMRSTLPATISITSNISPTIGRVVADASQIHQILVNLCTNAAHAMRERPGRLELVFAPHEVSSAAPDEALGPGSYARLSVIDNGRGMDEGTQQRMFDPFFSTKPAGEGSGLGLAVVHGIVSDHGGLIRVKSALGSGTRIDIDLPSQPDEEKAASVRPTGMPRGDGQRILFIDDEAALCSSAEHLLGKLGYSVRAETNPAAALALVRADPTAFDLVLTDLTMPGTTGIEVANEVLRLNPVTKVLVATGFNGTWTRESVRELGIHDLLTKPLSLHTLAEVIQDALSAS